MTAGLRSLQTNWASQKMTFETIAHDDGGLLLANLIHINSQIVSHSGLNNEVARLECLPYHYFPNSTLEALFLNCNTTCVPCGMKSFKKRVQAV
jgi:hypothetical protein